MTVRRRENVVGDRIRAARKAHGLTQAELAEAVELTVESLSRAERGNILPTVVTLGRIASELGTTIDDLAGRVPDRRPVVASVRPESDDRIRLKRHIDELDPATVRKVLAIVTLLPR